jgi:hypothetical protein
MAATPANTFSGSRQFRPTSRARALGAISEREAADRPLTISRTAHPTGRKSEYIVPMAITQLDRRPSLPSPGSTYGGGECSKAQACSDWENYR